MVRARTELSATGARPRRLFNSGRDALTPSEPRVARMAAEGLTSQEIAQALFVTTKTVDSHLGHAYTKLGINSRKLLADTLGRAATQATRLRLLPGSTCRRRLRRTRARLAVGGRLRATVPSDANRLGRSVMYFEPLIVGPFSRH